MATDFIIELWLRNLLWNFSYRSNYRIRTMDLDMEPTLQKLLRNMATDLVTKSCPWNLLQRYGYGSCYGSTTTELSTKAMQ